MTTTYGEDPAMLTYPEQWTAPTKVHADAPNNFAPVMAYLGVLFVAGVFFTVRSLIGFVG